MIFILEKRNEDGKRHNLRPCALADHVKQLVTTSYGTMLTFWRLAKLAIIASLIKELLPAMNISVSSEKLL